MYIGYLLGRLSSRLFLNSCAIYSRQCFFHQLVVNRSEILIVLKQDYRHFNVSQCWLVFFLLFIFHAALWVVLYMERINANGLLVSQKYQFANC